MHNLRYQAVIFDVDGTLLDTIDGLMYSVNYSLKNFGYEGRNDDFIRRNTGLGVKFLLKQSFPEDADDATLKQAFKLFMEHYERTCNEGSAPYPGILELLDGLVKNGLKIAQASNKIQDAVRELNQHFFSSYNILCFGETPLQRRKPAPDMLNIAMQKMGVDKNQTVMVGDSMCDYEAAQNAGIDSVLVTWGFHTREQLCDAEKAYFVDTPKELLNYLIG